MDGQTDGWMDGRMDKPISEGQTETFRIHKFNKELLLAGAFACGSCVRTLVEVAAFVPAVIDRPAVVATAEERALEVGAVGLAARGGRRQVCLVACARVCHDAAVPRLPETEWMTGK